MLGTFVTAFNAATTGFAINVGLPTVVPKLSGAVRPTMMLADVHDAASVSLPALTILAKSDADKALEDLFISFPLYFTGFALIAGVVGFVVPFVAGLLKKK